MKFEFPEINKVSFETEVIAENEQIKPSISTDKSGAML